MRDEIEIRALKPEEEKRYLEVGRGAFDRVTGMGMVLRDVNLVAMKDGEILGGVIASVSNVKKVETVGVVRWLFVTSNARGRGVGGALIEACVDALDEAGAKWLFSDILGENTSSAGAVVGRGGRQVTPGEQIRSIGLMGTLRVWMNLRHWSHPGYFLYGWSFEKSKAEVQKEPYRSGEFMYSLVVVALLSSLAAWRGGQALLAVMVMATSALLIREIVVRFITRVQGMKIRHAAWESGVPIGVFLAGLLGLYFPVYGGLYPKDQGWRAREETRRRGLAVLPLAILWLFLYALSHNAGIPAEWGAAMRSVAIPMLLFGVVLGIPPFQAFDASRLREWSIALWIGLSAATLGLWLYF